MVENISPVARRSFLSRFGAGAAVFGAATAVALPSRSQAAATNFQPRRHNEDAWMDAPKGVHRLVIDSSTADSGGAALLYASNFFAANKAGYNLDTPDIAVIVVLRHLSTPFGFTDAMWAKYGAAFSELTSFKDPKTKAAPTTNLYNSGEYGLTLPNFGNTIPSLVQKNVQFAICMMATRFVSGAIAERSKGNADTIYQELSTNLIANSHLVAAGVVAVNRAQEHGYSLLAAG
jgi:intracellular sulfur oxidation DsrE/DsrF family protein